MSYPFSPKALEIDVKVILWVIEIWIAENDQWEPTVGVGLTREVAREEIKQWRTDNPSDQFRIVSYIREDR